LEKNTVINEPSLFDSIDDVEIQRGSGCDGLVEVQLNAEIPCAATVVASSIESSDEGGASCQKGAEENSARAPQSDWHEVPLDTFLAWSEVQQLEYCAARDLDSAEFADNEHDMAFFLERAKWYAERIEELKRLEK
jgi:hypothetical protein